MLANLIEYRVRQLKRLYTTLVQEFSFPRPNHFNKIITIHESIVNWLLMLTVQWIESLSPLQNRFPVLAIWLNYIQVLKWKCSLWTFHNCISSWIIDPWIIVVVTNIQFQPFQHIHIHSTISHVWTQFQFISVSQSVSQSVSCAQQWKSFAEIQKLYSV